MAIQIQLRRGTAAQWTSSNPTLAVGELALETDTDQFKIGDGVTAWAGLAYGGIQGPTGPTGNTGPTGPAGATGPGVANVTATAEELNILDGATLTTTELNHVDGVTSGIQGQLDGKAPIANPTFTGVVAGNASAGSTAANGANALGFKGIPASGAGASGAYTLVAGDAGELVYTTTTRTVTIPANSSVAYQIGTTIVFVSGNGATTTIAITSDTMRLAGAGTTGSRTLAAHGMATAVKVAATEWYISGNGLT